MDRYVDYVPLDQVKLAPRNPKGHNADGIRTSIGHFGFAELPLIDERTGRLVAGHGRHEQLVAMHDAGHTPPDGIRVTDNGAWCMPVIRGWASRSDADAEAYLIGSNQWTIAGGWNDDDLAAVLTDLAEQDLLDLTGFTDDLLAELLTGENKGRELPAALTDPDDVPELSGATVSVFGDLWLVGPHRLLCGDATNPDHVNQVTGSNEVAIVYTDPPYGIDIVRSAAVGGRGPFGGVKKARLPGTVGAGKIVKPTTYLPVAGDGDRQAASDAFRLLISSYGTARHVWWGGNHYTASAALPDGSCWLVWDKENTGNFADAELAWTNHPGAVRLLRHMWNGMLRASERGGGQRVHPTQKPVALATWALGVVDPDNDRRTVLDPFAGSGSTLIAAHQTNRTAFLMELEPYYVDVICRRYQEHTGVVPVLASTGEPHDFTE